MKPGAKSRAEVPCATSPSSLEWKKRVDFLLGVPIAALAGALSRLRRRAAPAEVRHVVLAKLWGIGNLAMVMPYVAAVRRRHPRARVTFVTLRRNLPLLRGQPGIDRILALRDGGGLAPLVDLIGIVGELRRDRADLFLDFEQFLRAAGIAAWLSGARFRAGFDTPGQRRAALYDVTVPCRGDRHMAHGFAELVRAAGVATDGCASHEIHVEAAAAAQVDALLGRGLPRPWIVLHPGSGDNFPGRRWPAASFAEAGARLASDSGGSLLLTGGGSERTILDEVRARLAALGARAVDLGGRLDLPQLVALLARSDLLLSNDTGPVHLAAAVRTPVVAFYGPNSPRLYGPLGPDHRALHRPLPCSPCLTNQNGKSSRCTLPLCIRRIPADDAVKAGRELLAARRFAVARAAQGSPA